MTAEFWLWADPIRNISFGIANAADWGQNFLASFNNLNGDNWTMWDGSAYSGVVDITADWLPAEWNKMTVHWDGTALTGSVNDGEAFELLWWGGATLPIDRLRFRGGDGTSTYYLDDVAVVANGALLPEPQEAQN